VRRATKGLRLLLVPALTASVAVSTGTAASAAPSKAELTKQITEQEQKLENIVESYNKNTEQVNKTKAKEAALDKQMGPILAQVNAAGAAVGVLARQAYEEGGVGPANALLGNGGDLMDQLGMLAHLSRSRQQVVTTYKDSTDRYTATKAALQVTQDKAQAQADLLTAQKKDILAKIDKLKKSKLAVYGRETDPPASAHHGPVPSISGAAGIAVRFAYAQLDKPYGFATAGPRTYDCSGLTMAAWAAAGKSLPHNAAEQYSATARISRGQLRAGDLVFYRNLGHVGLFVGGGKIINAPHEGALVRENSIDIMPPYGYGRVR
jgi:peptidoglycan DL-endopeptidase CwlO